MKPGTVIAERFEIESRAGRGGMATVYRARDRSVDTLVAVKVLELAGDVDRGRFDREAALLASLAHPGIVRHVDHGTTDDGRAYLVLEWLEGEDLGRRLAREGLSADEAVDLCTRVADTLAFAHRCGVIHRDLKPSNLFLVGGALDRIKVLDFGVARAASFGAPLTLTGAMVGTPGYMAPEQVRGRADIDARADVFALGSVLFRCLTGRRPFEGSDLVAVLMKTVLEDAPRARDLVPSLPDALDGVVAAMLAREATERIGEMTEVVQRLTALRRTGGAPVVAGVAAEPSAVLTGHERRVVSLVVGRPRRSGPVADTVEARPLGVAEGALRRAAERVGGSVDVLADGSVLVTLSGLHAATDLAARAARCALAERAVLPTSDWAIVTGRSALAHARAPFGDLVERAARLLVAAEPTPASGVRLDDVTAGLLDARFDVAGDATGLYLRGERAEDSARTFLGRPTPCVGRERELAALVGLFEECVDEARGAAAVVTGPAGVGKSRLRYELLDRLGRGADPPLVLLGRADPMSAGSPFALVADALRRAAGIVDDEALAVRQQKLSARVGRHVAPGERARVSEFLGELLGVAFPDETSVMLRAARADSVLMGDQIRRAWEDWLEAECAAQPLVLVLEDLHWGDLPSVKLVDGALRVLTSRPFFVLALARSEVRTLFPDLWSDRGTTRIELTQLSRRASERFVRAVLGDGVAVATVARVVEQAAGNAFFLEEIVRAVADGRGDALPDTVLAMVESRLEELDGDARRVLRAASVFGQVFWEGAVAGLLGTGVPPVAGVLVALAERELVTRRPSSRFAAEVEHTFRHAIVRDAAYGMLTEHDRALGHRLAGQWLERQGDRDALAVAEHLERGGDARRACAFYLRAAEQALEGDDFAAAVERATRGLASGAAGSERGVLLLRKAEAHGWRGENADLVLAVEEALGLLPVGGGPWCAAAAQLALGGARLGRRDRLLSLADDVERLLGDAAPTPALLIAASRAAHSLYHLGARSRADALLARIEARAELAADEPAVRARMLAAQAYRALSEGDPTVTARLREASAQAYERAGDLRNACLTRVNAAHARLGLGAHADAERLLRETLAAAERMGLRGVVAGSKHNLGLVLLRLGRAEEAAAVEEQALAEYREQGDRRMQGACKMYLASILSALGRDADAEREADEAVELVAAAPPLLPLALATSARVRAARAPAEALALAERALGLLESAGGEEADEVVRLTFAQIAAASGDRARADAVARAAASRLEARAARIADPEARATFCSAVPEHAKLLEWPAGS